MKHALLGKIAFAAAVVFLIGACGSAAFGFQAKFFSWDVSTSKTKVLSAKDVKTETKTVDADDAKTVDVDLHLGAGELNLTGGSQPLMTGDFTYNEELKPEVNYKVSGSKGHLQVKQADPLFKVHLGNHSNRWDVKLNNDIPLDLKVNSGASKSSLHLSDIRLQHLYVNMGVGKTTIDLDGDWDNSFDVDIDSGVGQTTILLPKETGVKVDIDKGLGQISTEGLSKEDGHYVNEAYGAADATIDIALEMGVGQVILKVGE